MTARALITGIGGQDGTYLAERLVAEGMEVHGLVLRADGHPDHCPDEVVLHTGDLGDLDATRRLVLELAPKEVYNLAAIVRSPSRGRSPTAPPTSTASPPSR